MKTKSFYYPLKIFLLCFLIDKSLYYKPILYSLVKWNHFEMIAYQTREALFDLYKGDQKPKIVLIGSSKLASIQRDDVEKNFLNFSFYNFCVPLPNVAYLFYVMRRLKDYDRPKLILLELDLPMFTRRAREYPFRYGIPLKFFFDYLRLWNKEDLGNYLGKKLFLVGRYPVSFSAILENQSFISYPKEDGHIEKFQKKEFFSLTEKSFLELVYENHGGIQVPYASQTKDLRIDASQKWNEFFREEKFPKEQIPFLREMIYELKINSIDFVVILSSSTFEFQKKLIYNEQEKFFNEVLNEFIDRKVILDLRKFDCNHFEDSFHLQGECINKLSDKIVQEIAQRLKEYNLQN